ncbi:hypothetical protein [Cohaesibacter celericrescens]|uniref:hypothetical protein n=1 Tax=Cohaesibacter celericrescens TaxID=2067669 RepID=UPI00356785D0
MNPLRIASISFLCSSLAFLAVTVGQSSEAFAGERWRDYGSAMFVAKRMKLRGYELESIACKHHPMKRKRTTGKPFNKELQVQLHYSKRKGKGKAKTHFDASILGGNADLGRFMKSRYRVERYTPRTGHGVPTDYVVVRENNSKNGKPIFVCYISKSIRPDNK